MLTAKNITKSYSTLKVLDDVSMHIERGQIRGLLGPNGAGKTTLFRILSALVKPDSGEVYIASDKVKAVGAIIEKPGLYPYLNAADNLRVFAGVQGIYLTNREIQVHLDQVGLPLHRKDPVRNYSLGMKQRLGIAIALLNDPACLVLDEPFSGLDPFGVKDLLQLIQSLAEEQQIAVLLSSHLLNELSACCHYLYAIDQGKLISEGTTAKLMQQHVRHYTIRGEQLWASDKSDGRWLDRDRSAIRVPCSPEELPLLLAGLLNDGVRIQACIPEWSLESLIGKEVN